MLDLATATSTQVVQAACAHKEKRTYDPKRHMYLRRTFVAVYVCDEGKCVIDTHKHAMEQGGWSEHQLFVRFVHSPDHEDVMDLPRGPGKRAPRKHRKKKIPRSELLKAMWQAPDPEDDEDVLEVDHQQPDKETKPLSAWFLAPDDGNCLAQTGASKRCSIARCVGSMYCKQHTNSEKAQKVLF